MKKDVSLHYQKTNKMDNKDNLTSLMDTWRKFYDFQKTSTFNELTIKEKREFKKLEDKLFKFAKTLYYNDVLFEKSNTTERTINI